MTEGTQEDWDRIVAAQLEFYPGLADRVMTHLGLLAGDYGGFVVDRLVHSTQTATRAMRANRSDDYIACALLHDIGDTLGSFNHPDIGAAIVWPFVDDDLHWMVQQHGIFQGYYFFDYLGLDPNLRAEFCADFDQAAFDPAYPTMELEEFRPLLEGFFARPKRSIYMRGDQS